MTALGQPRFRADQIYSALHRIGAVEWSDVKAVPKALSHDLARRRPLRTLEVEIDRVSPRDGTNKLLFRAIDGGAVESVVMSAHDVPRERNTVCVSSQIGCPAGCTFCASGLGGLSRNLHVAEIVDQVEYCAGRLRHCARRLHNVVFMGMGEPFLNYRRVMESIERLRDAGGLGLGARRITVSTVGIAPVIERFARDAGEVNLAVSLHAPNDDLRSRLVPYNRRFPIRQVMEAVGAYIGLTRRRVSFEYVLLQNVNDSNALALDLAHLLKPLNPMVHVNVIPWNPFPEVGFTRATRSVAESFAGAVRQGHVNATVRYSKGLDIDAACGQLRNRARSVTLAS
jgi:23S rRNA (adenine2503-C2)-methyltransferase